MWCQCPNRATESVGILVEVEAKRDVRTLLLSSQLLVVE